MDQLFGSTYLRNESPLHKTFPLSNSASTGSLIDKQKGKDRKIDILSIPDRVISSLVTPPHSRFGSVRVNNSALSTYPRLVEGSTLTSLTKQLPSLKGPTHDKPFSETGDKHIETTCRYCEKEKRHRIWNQISRYLPVAADPVSHLINVPIAKLALLQLPLAYMKSFKGVVPRLIGIGMCGILLSGRIAEISPALGLATSLATDGAILTATAIGAARALKDGIKCFTKNPTAKKRIKGAFLIGAAIGGIASSIYTIKNIASGLFAFSSLNDAQRYFVLKHQALSSFRSEEKNCRAVVIDGMSSQWADNPQGALLDDMSWPPIAELYRHCNVRVYRADPTSRSPVCQAAEIGEKELGGPLDLLFLAGHSWPQGMRLNEDTYFWGTDREVSCFSQHLQDKGQIVLAGCNTATGENSLAERVSGSSNRETIGCAAYLNPFFTSLSWVENKLGVRSVYPMDSNGQWTGFMENTARTFVPSNQ